MRTTTPIDWRAIHGDSFAGLRVLVTGGAGFIGSHLATALTALNARVTVLDDLSNGNTANLQHLPSGSRDGQVDFIQASVLDEKAIASCTRECEFVFHQAALGSVPRSVEHPVLYQQVNANGTMCVLEAARKAGTVRRVMFAASSSAYGDTVTLPKVETMPPTPRSPYAATKVAGEALCRAYAASYGLDTAPLRYFNIFGPRQSPDSAYAAVIAAFAKAILGGQRPIIHGDGQQSRDFTYVDNAVHANLLAARRSSPIHGEVINVACGARVTVLELARAMSEIFGRPDILPEFRPARAGDVKHSLADLNRARTVLDYVPLVDFRAGLLAASEWYASSLGRRAPIN